MNLKMENNVYQISDDVKVIHENDLSSHANELIIIPPSVQRIEEGSFAHGKQQMRILLRDNPYYTYDHHFLIENHTRKLIAFTGDDEVIHVPAHLSSISKWAFYELIADQVIFSDEIQEIHENAFTTCRIKEAVFPFWNAHLFFPDKDIRLRQYLWEGFGIHGMFDFSRYDEGIVAGYMEPERIKEMTARLKWPYALSEEYADDYRQTLQKHLNEVLKQLAGIQDIQTIFWLCDLQIINQHNQEDALKILHSQNDLSVYMELSRYLHDTGRNQSFDFSI